jgi:UDPglucose 6-dehydrogenase
MWSTFLEKDKTSMKTTKVSIIGTGKLGMSMAVAMAKRGCQVIGVDINPEAIRKINAGQSPVEETGLQDLLTTFGRRITATDDMEQAVLNSEVSFVVVATPSQADGAFSNHQLLPAMERIGRALRRKKTYHRVVITCTVMPGTTDTIIRPLLEKRSGKKCGRDFGLVYNPEFIALGSVIHDFLNPDFVLMGTREEKAREWMERFYARVCENRAPVQTLTPVEAEIGKISLNCYCTMKITFANMIAEVAEAIPGVDASKINRAIGLDTRIGLRYLAPGLGFGGPCFPRDNVAFRVFAERLNITAFLPEAVHTSNRRQAERAVRRVRSILPKGGKVAVLGLSYKPFTPVIEESQALQVAQQLAGTPGVQVAVYDPQALEAARKVLPKSVEFAASMKTCLEGADLMILATPWPEFTTIKPALLEKTMRRPAMIDCWRCWNPKTGRGKVRYWATGLGAEKRPGA